jgi:hypothetical protein
MKFVPPTLTLPGFPLQIAVIGERFHHDEMRLPGDFDGKSRN